MHTQFIIDNTRSFIDSNPRSIERLTAEMIHSALFHQEISYIDAYLVNNPLFIAAARNNQTVIDLFDLDCSHIALIDRNKSLLNNLEYLIREKIWHPGFESEDALASTADIIQRIERKCKIIPYSINGYRNEFTEMVLDEFKSEYAQILLNVPSRALELAMRDMIEEKKDKTGETTLGQADFEHANRAMAPFRVHLTKHAPHIDFDNIHSEILNIERYCYRKSRASALTNSVISHHEHRALNSHRLPISGEFANKSILLSSEWFHASNLTHLTAQDISNIRSTEEYHNFIYYVDATKEYSPLETVERLHTNTARYIEKIDSYISDSIPINRRIRFIGNKVAIKPCFIAAKTSANISTKLYSKNAPFYTKMTELFIKIISKLDGTHKETWDTLTEFSKNICKTAPIFDFVSTKTEVTIDSIQRHLDKKYGDRVTSVFENNNDTSY